MSYESDECKLLIDEAIHDYLHDDTENEMAVKDWFYDLRKQAAKVDEYEAKAKAFDAIHEVKIKAIKECNYLISPKFFKMFGMKAFRKLEEIEEEHESGEPNELRE